MPNIKREERISDNQEIKQVKLDTKAQLTYIVYKFALQYVIKHGFNYDTISDAKAALRDAADEVQWRLMQPREKAAITKNDPLNEEVTLAKKYPDLEYLITDVYHG